LLIFSVLLIFSPVNPVKSINLESSTNKSYYTLELTDKDVTSAVNNSSLFILTFYEPGCGSCKTVNKTTMEISEELQGQIAVGRMNVRSNDTHQTLKKYKISTAPTLLIFDNGLLIDRMKRNISKYEILVDLVGIKQDLNTSKVPLPMINATAEGWLEQGNEYFQAGLFDLADRSYDKSIMLNNSYAYAWNNKCSALGNQRKFNEAAQACDEAVNLDPKLIPAWLSKGSALLNQNKSDEALKAFDRAISLDPNNAIAWTGKGKALKKLNRTAESDAAFIKARELGIRAAPSYDKHV
jgi:tetratricopeptide (TPR) repeat protein